MELRWFEMISLATDIDFISANLKEGRGLRYFNQSNLNLHFEEFECYYFRADEILKVVRSIIDKNDFSRIFLRSITFGVVHELTFCKF